MPAELARTIAARTRAPGVTRVICPPFVCLAPVRDALAGEDVAVGAQNVHHELAGAFTGEVSAPMLAGLATWVILGHSERRRAARRDRRPHRPQARPGGRRRAAADPVRRRGAGGARGGPRGRRGRRPAARVRSTGATPGALAAAGLVIAYEPVWAIGTGRNARGADAAAMADAIRAALADLGWGGGRRRRPGALRRQRHVRQHRRVPRRARDRRRARRRGLAQARRDGRDRRPRRPHRRGPRPRRVTEPGADEAPDARPRPIVLVVLDGFGIGRDPAADAIAAAPDAPLARAARALAPQRPPGVGGRRRPAARPDGQLRGRPPEPRRRPAGAPGPAPDRRGDRGRLVRRAAGAARRLRAGPPDRPPAHGRAGRAGRGPRQ